MNLIEETSDKLAELIKQYTTNVPPLMLIEFKLTEMVNEIEARVKEAMHSQAKISTEELLTAVFKEIGGE